MKKTMFLIFGVSLLATSFGCATWQTKDGFEAGRLATQALQANASLVCEGEGSEDLSKKEQEKCDAFFKVSEDVVQSLIILEAAWKDLAPMFGLPEEVESQKKSE